MNEPTGPVSDPLIEAARRLPFLTADSQGVGGRIKQQPEDFVVEEIPAYEPSGVGEHLFLWIEKRDVSGVELLRRVARRLAISTGDIGMAGVKDRRAVTRQWISVPARCQPAVAQIDEPDIHVLRSVLHPHKLRTGHLRGNRFSIVVRDVITEEEDQRPTRITAALSVLGFPNYFGPQRFGRDGETLQLGLDLIRGKAKPRSIRPSQRRFLLRMALSSVQSALFNAVLAARIRAGRLHTVVSGDVMQVVASGGPFVVEDADVEQGRFAAKETVITGPIFGSKMRSPQGEAAVLEQDVLAAFGLNAADFDRFSKLTSGTRRPLLVWPEQFTVGFGGSTLSLQFVLPSGAYATVLLREFTKCDSEEVDSADE